MEKHNTILVDGVECSLNIFSEKVQNLVYLRQEWNSELAKERSQVIKTETALKQLDAELSVLIGAEMNAIKEKKSNDNQG